MAKISTFYDHMKDIARQENISVVEAMQEAKAMGVELLEVSDSNILGREKEVERELAAAGLGISCIPSYFDFGRDGDVDRQADPILEAARYLGAPKLLVIPGFFKAEDGGAERERQKEGMVRGINRLGEKAPAYGVEMTMEDYDNELAPFSNKEGVRWFLDRCPRLACCLDTGNFRRAGQDELEAYEFLKDRIGHVHLKDKSYVQANGEPGMVSVDGKGLYPCAVGSGELKLGELIARLKRDGYDGAYTIEHYDSNATLSYLKSSVEWVEKQLF